MQSNKELLKSNIFKQNESKQNKLLSQKQYEYD